MFKKLYEKVKKYIKQNHNFILFLILLVLVLNIKLPYVVERPGGISSLNEHIKINGKNIKGDYNTAYVRVNNGSVVSVLLSFVIPNWDLEPLSNFTNDEDETYNEVLSLDRKAMLYSQNTAIKLVFDKLDIPYSIDSENLYVYSKINGYKNDFKYGDQIIKCDGEKLNYMEDLSTCINNSVDNQVDIEVLRDKKNILLGVDLEFSEGKKIMGIVVLRDFNINSDIKIAFSNDSNESGASGGLMTALALYDNLSSKDLIRKYKVAGTGTIDDCGNVGEIDGIKYKLLGAKNKVDIFFVPAKNYEEALDVKKKHHLKINIVEVSNIDDAINYLENYQK